jgi:hypothetical protein
MAGQTPESKFTDAILICVDCEEEFVFTASAQQYFAERGFHEPPKRCKACYNDFRRNAPPQDGASIPEGPTPMPPPTLGSGRATGASRS